MVKRRGPLKPGEPGTYTTSDSGAFEWIEDRKVPKYERIKAKFPYVEDRKAANINYSDPNLNREYRGKAPQPGPDYNNLTVKPPRDFSSQEYMFISDATNGGNVPEGYYGTSSGIFPIDFTPFTIGLPSDTPVIIGPELDVSNVSSGTAEFFVARYALIDNMQGILKYYPSGPDTGRFEWEILPEFDNPTEPDTRYPSGARRKRTFKY